MRVIGWCLVILAAAFAFAGESELQSQETQSGRIPPTFSLAISTPQNVKIGSEIVVDISLTNKSGRTIKMYYNDLARDDEYTVGVFDEAGNRPPLTWTGRNVIDHSPGVRVFRPHMPNRDVEDGDVLKQRLTISKFFDFSKPGTYTIQLSRGEGETVIKSNTITVTVTP